MRTHQPTCNSKYFYRLAVLLCLLLPLTRMAAYGQVASPPTPVGQTSGVIQAAVNFTTAGTLGNITVATQGAQNKDYKAASGSTCVIGSFYSLGQYCIVDYTFSPLAAGERQGAVVATDSSGNVLGTTYLSGVGVGPMGLFSSPTATWSVSNSNLPVVDIPRGISVDGNGNVYFANTGGSQGLNEIPQGGGSVTQVVATSVGTGATAVDGAGNVYLADANQQSIFELVNGQLVTIASGFAPDDNLEVDGAGNLYTSDYYTGAIYEIAAGTHTVTTIVPGNLGHRFIGMAGDPAGDIFAADFNNNVVYEIKAGTSGASALIPIAVGGPLSNPHAVAVDPAGNVYVGNLTGESNILRYAAGTWAVTLLPATGTRSIVLDGSGNIYTVVNDSTIASYSRLNPPAIQFPSTAYGSTSSAPLVEFENDGNAGLIISAYTASTNFGVNGAGNTCQTGTLNAGATCFIGATFTPLAIGNLSGSLSLADNNFNQTNAQQNVDLSGSGTQASLTVTASNESMAYGDMPPVVVPNYAGFVNGDTEGSLTSLPTCTTTATATSDVGTYSTSCTGGADPNYIFHYVNGTMTVNPAPPVISFSLASPATVNGTAGLNATASNGAPVSYTVSSGTATINGSSITYTNAGQVTITASTAASTDYTAASAAQMVTVNPEPISYAAPETSVGQSSAVQTAWVNIATAGTPASIRVVTQGATGKDFNPPSPVTISGLDCSTSPAYSAGQACAVQYVFSPTSPGEREGGVVLQDSNGTVLGSSFLGGVGDGPLGLFSSPTASWSVSDPNLVNIARGISVDGNGNVYFANTSGSQGLNEIPQGGGSVTQVVATSVGTGATAVDGAGNVYLADANQQSIFELVNGQLVTIASGFAPDDNLEVDGAGNLYTSDYYTGAIYEIAAGTHTVTIIVPGNLGHRFIGMAGDPAGDIFAADFNNNVVYEIKAGTSGAAALIPIASGGPLSNPHAVAVDPAGNVYVGNLTGESNILRYAAGTWAVTLLPATGTRSIVLDGSGNIYTVVNDGTIASYSRLNPPAMQFPSTVYGTTSSAPVVEFENDGNAGLIISAYSASANFGVNGAGNTCATGTLNAGATCFIGATFTPLAVGNLSGSLSLTDNTLNQTNAQQSISLSGTATPAPVTFNVTGYNVTYDGTAHTAPITATGVGGTDLSGDLNLSGTIHTNAGTYANDSWSFHDPNGVYQDASGTVNDVINKANAIVSVTPYNVTYDGAAHTATGTITGVGGAALTGLNLTGTTHTNAGTYATDGWSFTDTTGNYNNASGTVNDVINKANAIVSVTPYNVTYDGAAHTATGTVTGVGGAALTGLNLTGTTHTNAGTYATDGWSFTDTTGNYNNASGTVNDVINKANAIVSVTPYNVTYDGAAHTATGTVTGVGGAALTGLNLTGTTHTNAGTYATDGWTFTDTTGNYNNASGTVSDSIAPAPLTVTANNAFTTYGAGMPAFAGSVSGAVNGDTFVESFTTAANDASPVGVYAITPGVTGTDLANYSVRYVPGVLTINPAPLTITANAQTKVLNAPNPTLTASYSGFVLGEGQVVLSGTLNCTTTAVLNSPVGSYPITCSGQSSTNYAITYVPGKLSVLYLVGACPVPQHHGDNDGGDQDGDHGSNHLVLSHVILDPIKADGSSVFDGHGDLPVRFRVCDANGNSIGDPNLIVSFVSLNGPKPTSLGDRNDLGWHFDGDWDQTPNHDQDHANPQPKWTYHLSLRTLANATYNYLITLNDGTTIPFSFTVAQNGDH